MNGATPLKPLPEHARDQRRDARPGRGHGGEIDGGEEDERAESHVGRLGLRLRQDVERLDHRGKKHRGVNIASFDMKAETVGDQRHADHQEEAQRQHQNGRIAVDERRQRPHGDHHHPDRHDDGYDHDRKILGHADGRDDAVDREDDVDHDDLDEARDEAERRSRLFVVTLVIRIDAVVDLASSPSRPGTGRPPATADRARKRRVRAPCPAAP